ncbi:hypothetical protein ACLBKS_02155 [Hylemonella sp. W303a]|uniref:TipJ family phage tail tip protein n=1 Tax=Hylemonella sp. W303a TaxID=3389873 RepID=UPI00396B229A
MESYSLVLAPQPMQPPLLPRVVEVLPDETLASFLQREANITDQHGDAWSVSISGLEVPCNMWSRMRVKPGQTIEVQALVRGDDARSVVAIVAIAVLTYYTAGAGATWAAGAGAAAPAVYGLAYAGGMMLIQRHLMPTLREPARGVDQGPPTYSLQGGRNRPRPYESMCLVLGETKCVPDYAAQPYTWFEGSDQYMAATFHAGINCASVSDIKLGQTDLSNYADVQVLKNGFPSGNTDAPLFKPTNVDTSEGLLLDAPSSPGEWTVRTTSPNTVRIALDIEASLYGMSSTGKLTERVLHLEAEYRAAGSSGLWTTLYKTEPYKVTVDGHLEYSPIDGSEVWVEPYTDTYTPVDIELKSSSTKPVRLTAVVDLPQENAPEHGQYEVRVRKVTANYTGQRGSNTVYWQALKSYQKQTSTYEQLPRVQVVVRASGQLNGSLDELSWVARSEPLELWDGSSWITVSEPGSNGTSNPGAQILKVLRGWTRESDGKLLAGGGLPEDRIDLETLKAFMVDCTLNDWRCDLFLQERSPDIGRLLGIIATCGFGRVSRGRTGRWGVTWMSPNQPHQGTINMAVMKARSFSVHYDLARTADEVQLEYFDAARNYTWQSVRVQPPGIEVPQATYRESIAGIYHEAQAAEHARFKLAQSMFGRRSISFELDLLYRIYSANQIIQLSHDLTQWGYGGAVRGITLHGSLGEGEEGFTVLLDKPVPAADLEPLRMLGLALPGERSMRVFEVSSVAVDGSSIRVSTAWPSGVSVPGMEASTHVRDTLWMYDFKETPGMRVRITEVRPNAALTGAVITAVPEPKEFWDYILNNTYTPPPSATLLPRAPSITRVLVSEDRQQTGEAWYNEATAICSISGQCDYMELWGALEDLNSTSVAPPMRLLSSVRRSAQISWRASVGETWLLELRPYNGALRGQPYTLSYTAKGLLAPPLPVQNLTGTAEGANGAAPGWRLRWTASPESDVVGYEVRTSDFGWGDPGEDSKILYSGRDLNCLVQPATIGAAETWYVRPYDSSGVYSEQSTSISLTSTAPDDLVGDIRHVFADTSLTAATVTLDWSWSTATEPIFGLRCYRISYTPEGPEEPEVKEVDANTITLAANWLGDRIFTLQRVDKLGHVSAGRVISLHKARPAQVQNFRAQTIGNRAIFYWDMPASTTLPVLDVVIRVGDSWDESDLVGYKNGSFTVTDVLEAGNYTYWMAVRDTDGYLSDPVSLTVRLTGPAGFVFFGDFDDTLTGGTLVNAVREEVVGTPQGRRILLPLKTTETFAEHFNSNEWTTPQDQVAAGLPIFAQPGMGSGSYEVVFDFGSTLPACQVSLSVAGDAIAGDPAVTVRLYTSNDAVSWLFAGAGSGGSVGAFATAFEYIKARVEVAANSGDDLYSINGLRVSLDAQKKTANGIVGAVAADLVGTIVNFPEEFYDVTAITMSIAGAVPLQPTYAFNHAHIDGSYIVASNVATVNCPAHDLVAGQTVRLNTGSGTMPSGIYEVSGVIDANNYTVAVTTADSSGSLLAYAQSFRVYAFNSAGSRADAVLSYSIGGY